MKLNLIRGIFGIAVLVVSISVSGCTNSVVEVANSNANNKNQNVSSAVSNKMPDNTDSTTNSKPTEKSSADAGKNVEVKGDFSHIKSEHATVLKSWLSGNKDWEPAVKNDAEAVNPGSENHPFYIAADFNKDGKEDFAAGLVRTDNRKKHAFIIFNAPFTSKEPAYFGDKTESYDILSYTAEYGIFIGPAQSDNGYRLSPKGDKYVVIMAVDEMP